MGGRPFISGELTKYAISGLLCTVTGFEAIQPSSSTGKRPGTKCANHLGGCSDKQVFRMGREVRQFDRQINMVAKRLVGTGAGVRKYDLLTALAVAGLAGTPAFCMSMTRLIALVTARYNWRLDEVSVGQEELARLWSVDVRTVKREIKRLREVGILVVKQPGVRGRVASYALDHARIDALTGEVWSRVGTDYRDRMGQGSSTASAGNVLAFPRTEDSTPWSSIRSHLAAAHPARFQAWYAPLKRETEDGPVLVLRAPSSFHADYVITHLLGDLVRATQAEMPGISAVRIEAP